MLTIREITIKTTSNTKQCTIGYKRSTWRTNFRRCLHVILESPAWLLYTCESGEMRQKGLLGFPTEYDVLNISSSLCNRATVNSLYLFYCPCSWGRRWNLSTLSFMQCSGHVKISGLEPEEFGIVGFIRLIKNIPCTLWTLRNFYVSPNKTEPWSPFSIFFVS